jgi:hypothetical protein
MRVISVSGVQPRCVLVKKLTNFSGPVGEPLGGNVLRRDRVKGLTAHADDLDLGDADQGLALGQRPVQAPGPDGAGAAQCLARLG